jgi:sulfur carrier protein
VIEVRVNGALTSFPVDATLAAAVAGLGATTTGATTTGATTTGVAVAVDGAVVPRSQWASTPLRHGAVVEIVTAVQGG